jgi:HlyD family secretion protein
MRKTKRPILVITGVLALIAVVGVGAYLAFGTRRATATNLATATVERGTLVATVNAAGNITAHRQVALNFGQSGTVQKVNVSVGDRVTAGQVLAEMNTADLQLQLEDAKVNLRTAQAKLAQTKNPTTAQDIANARAQLDAAKANYNKLASGPSQAELTAAQGAVTSAQAAHDAALKAAGAPSSQLAQAQATLEKAAAALQSAQTAYDRVAWRPDVGRTQQAVTLANATADYNSAKAAYDALLATSGADQNTKVQQAKSQLEQAQANLANLQNQVTQDDLTASQAQVTQAQNNLDKLLAGPDANALDIAQNTVDQADIAVRQAQLKLDQSRIVAPFDGVVTAVNITIGQNAPTSGTTGAIQLADLDHLEIVVNTSEVDISRLKEGQTAQITLDAVPNVTLNGKVSQIAPAGVQSQGVVNYPVTIALDNPPKSVKTGMTANVNIIVEERDNVLTVPNRALKTQNRQYFATVLFEGAQMQVPVTVGMSSDTATEIVSGLKEGDTVVLSSTTTTQSRTGGGPGGFGPGMFFGRD